jgi:hypothetical protein
MKFVENHRPQRSAEIDIPNGMWVLRVQVSTRLASHPLDKRMGRNPEGGQPDARLRPLTQVVTRFARVLCADPTEVQVHRAFLRVPGPEDAHYWSNEDELVLVSPNPFVVVYMNDDQEYPDQSGYRRESVRVPRQVHKGELSQIFRPGQIRSFASDVVVDTDKPPIRFVRLTDVATNVGMDPMETLHLFAQMSPSSYYDPNAAVCLGPSVLDGKIVGGERLRVYLNNLPQGGDCGGAESWGGKRAVAWKGFVSKQRPEIFIPERWALDIFALAHFGFIPGVNESPKGAFDLKAERPQPYAVPGMLPVRPIDEIRELRGNRSEELSRFRFQEHVARATGQSAWRRAEQLDDRGSFQYYNEYQTIKLFDGRLTIATSFWSRAGHGKGEYWAGFIAVHNVEPPVVQGGRVVASTDPPDPRRDPAIYRLMIWPGQILRETPKGAVNGFFPELPGIDPEIMATIRRIMQPFGFKEEAERRAA